MTVGAILEQKFYMGYESSLDKLYAKAATTASDALSSVRIVQAYSLTPHIVTMYRDLLREPARAVMKQGATTGAGFGYSQGVQVRGWAGVLGECE